MSNFPNDCIDRFSYLARNGDNDPHLPERFFLTHKLLCVYRNTPYHAKIYDTMMELSSKFLQRLQNDGFEDMCEIAMGLSIYREYSSRVSRDPLPNEVEAREVASGSNLFEVLTNALVWFPIFESLGVHVLNKAEFQLHVDTIMYREKDQCEDEREYIDQLDMVCLKVIMGSEWGHKEITRREFQREYDFLMVEIPTIRSLQNPEVLGKVIFALEQLGGVDENLIEGLQEDLLELAGSRCTFAPSNASPYIKMHFIFGACLGFSQHI